MSVITKDKTIEFSSDLLQFIEDWKDKPGNIIMVLHRVQQEFGYLPRPAIIQLSQMLNSPLAKIYGVVTFYHYFKLTKPGRHNIQVCMGTACYLKGGEDLIHELENLLGIGLNQVSDDAVYALAAVSAIGENIDNESPERHDVRTLKRIAEKVLFEAFRTAVELAHEAKSLEKLAQEMKGGQP